ncbi:MAG: phosphoribosyltransferase [Alphaproteobacteria bacterium]|nr:phosphoribosyltransferase [Alphaproteobacteria bacterium]
MLEDRASAGARLARRLSAYRDAHPLVLALPRGGVPVAEEIARRLGAPLDVVIVRKIGAPFHEELAIGAVVDGAAPIVVLNDELVQATGASAQYIERTKAENLREMERRAALYRGGRHGYDVAGRTVILVDDGIATGATVRAALSAMRQAGAGRLVLAVPVAPPDIAASLAEEVDDLVCLEMPSPFYAVGGHYRHFPQISDGEVVAVLETAHRRRPLGPEPPAPSGAA